MNRSTIGQDPQPAIFGLVEVYRQTSEACPGND